jgi:hypothetical protein
MLRKGISFFFYIPTTISFIFIVIALFIPAFLISALISLWYFFNNQDQKDLIVDYIDFSSNVFSYITIFFQKVAGTYVR